MRRRGGRSVSAVVLYMVNEKARRMMVARFEVFEDKKGKWRWRLVAGNGEIVASSEAYDSAHNARRGVSDVAEAVEAATTRNVRVEVGHE